MENEWKMAGQLDETPSGLSAGVTPCGVGCGTSTGAKNTGSIGKP